MSQITATVSQIQKCDNLHIVKFEFNSQTLSMMSLELREDIKAGSKVKLSIKPTYVAIGKGISGELTYSNQLKAQIESIQNGELLSAVFLRLENGALLESIITKDSAFRLSLKEGDEVIALIKANEISITELLDA